jgi:hypothetical protein
MINWLRYRMNVWVLLGMLVISGGLTALLGALVLFTAPGSESTPAPQAYVTIIPMPPPTPTSDLFQPTPTPTLLPPGEGGIGIGVYVQITGTGGDGLRLRTGPSVSDPPRFLGGESEVFKVKDGPKPGDGFTWWFLEAPYDSGRSGWAASQYLSVVGEPQP